MKLINLMTRNIFKNFGFLILIIILFFKTTYSENNKNNFYINNLPFPGDLSIPLPTSDYHGSSDFYDITADGVSDIINCSRERVAVYDGTTGNLVWENTYQYWYNGKMIDAGFSSIKVGDLNFDGNPEIVLLQDIHNGTDYTNQHMYVLDGSNGNILWNTQAGWPMDRSGLNFANIVGDSSLEILVNTTGSGGIQCFTYDGTRVFKVTPNGFNDPGEILSEDISGDGKGEIIACSMNYAYLIDSTGNVLQYYPKEFNGNDYGGIDAMDCNQDGIIDIVYSSKKRIKAVTLDNQLIWEWKFSDYGFDSTSYTYSVYAFDFDMDNEKEILTYKHSGFALLETNGQFLWGSGGGGNGGQQFAFMHYQSLNNYDLVSYNGTVYDSQTGTVLGHYSLNGQPKCVISLNNGTLFTTYDHLELRISPLINQNIQLIYPNGGEIFPADSNIYIQWNSSGISNLKIEYTIDNGINWHLITDSVPADSNRIKWKVPNFPSEKCKIKLSDAADGVPIDISNSTFTIKSYPKIFIDSDTLQGAGTQFWVDIQVGDSANPATDLFGVSFSLHYTNTQYIDVVSPYSANVLPGSFMGSNVVFLTYIDDPNGQIDIGISRQAGQGGVSGYGAVARVQFTTDVNTPHNTPITFTIDNISAIDPNGSPIQLDPQDVTIHITSTIVWPGDANNDGTANVADVLPLGLYYNSTGPARPNASMNWTGQVCPPGWSPEVVAYADCNGDGIVNVSDVLPIGLNYNQTHSKSRYVRKWLAFGEEGPMPQVRYTVYNKDMHPTTLSAIGDGEIFYLGFALDRAKDFVGVSFTLDWRGNGADAGSLVIDRQFGQNGLQVNSDWQTYLLTLHQPRESQQRCEFGFTLKSSDKRYDGSELALLKCRRSGSGALTLNITDLVALDWEGQYYQGSPLVGIGDSGEPLVIGKDFNLSNYPNPFNPTTTIRFALPQSEKVWLGIYNTLGQQVALLVNGANLAPGEHRYQFDASQLSNGVYFYRLQVGQQVVTRKMLLMK